MSGRGRSAVGYVALTFAWSWAWWGLAILSGQPLSTASTAVLYGLGGIGPAVAATLLVATGRGGERLGAFWRRAVQLRELTRPGPALAIGIIIAAPILVGRLAGGQGGAGNGIELTILIPAVVAGLAEEPGWRGYAHDAIAERRGFVAAALLVGTVWVAWHLPLYAIAGTFQHGLGLDSPAALWLTAGLIPWAILYAAVYVASGRSILAVVLMHAVQNVAFERFSVDGAEAIEVAVLVALAAIAIVWAPRRGACAAAVT